MLVSQARSRPSELLYADDTPLTHRERPSLVTIDALFTLLSGADFQGWIPRRFQADLLPTRPGQLPLPTRLLRLLSSRGPQARLNSQDISSLR